MFRVTPTKEGNFTVETEFDVDMVTDKNGTTSFIYASRDAVLGLLRDFFPLMSHIELAELFADVKSEIDDRTEQTIQRLEEMR